MPGKPMSMVTASSSKPVVAPEMEQGGEQGHAVLPAGDAHGDPVPRTEHPVIVRAAADVARESVEVHAITPKKKN